MVNGVGESSQSYDFTSKNMVHEGYGTGMSLYQPADTYSSQVVMALDQEVRRWQVHAAHLGSTTGDSSSRKLKPVLSAQARARTDQ